MSDCRTLKILLGFTLLVIFIIYFSLKQQKDLIYERTDKVISMPKIFIDNITRGLFDRNEETMPIVE